MRCSRALVAAVLLVAACNGSSDDRPPEEGSPVAAGPGRGDAGAAATADLEERLAPGVLTRIRDRVAWRDRILADPAVPLERQAEAEGEVAVLYHAYDLFEPARDAYSRAVERAPEDFRWRYLRGLAARRLNDLDAAEQDFERAVQLASDDVPSWVRLGEVARDLGRTDAAESALSRALELDPECAAALLAFGQQARADGELEEALGYLQRVLDLQPDASAVRTPLGLTYRDLGREQEAARQLDQAGEQGVRLVDPLLQRVHDLGEGWIAAMRTASEAAEEGDIETAEEQLKIAIGMDPLSAAPRISWARILAGRGDLAEAREQAELALFLSESELLPKRTQARIAIAAGDWPQAEAALRRVTALPGADRSDWSDLGAVLESSGRVEEALKVYRELRNRHPDDAMVLVGELTQLARLGRCNEARDIVSAQLARRSKDAILGHASSRLHSACGDGGSPEQALALAESLFAAVPTAGHAEAVAQAHAAAGRFDDAVEWQRRALAAGDESAPVAAHYRAVLQAFEQHVVPPLPWSPSVRPWIFAAPSGCSATSQALCPAAARTWAGLNPR